MKADKITTTRDVLGWRMKFGVLGPSTNTVVQPEFDDMRPAGVTNHYSRIYTPDATAIDNDTFLNATHTIAGNMLQAVDSVMTCKPDYLVMGMSAITFYGGLAGADEFQSMVQEAAGVGASIGSHSTAAALRALAHIERIAFISPYFPAANKEVTRYFEDNGFNVKRNVCLRCPSWTSIAAVPADVLRRKMRALDGDDVDALVQVGTNLPMARLAAELEGQFGKPVVAINTATYWHALRQNAITDTVAGFGKLLSKHCTL